MLWILMDFVHNPYRCGPLRVGRYGLELDSHCSDDSHCQYFPSQRSRVGVGMNRSVREGMPIYDYIAR